MNEVKDWRPIVLMYRNMYEKHSLTKSQVDGFLAAGVITEEEYYYIIGTEPNEKEVNNV